MTRTWIDVDVVVSPQDAHYGIRNMRIKVDIGEQFPQPRHCHDKVARDDKEGPRVDSANNVATFSGLSVGLLFLNYSIHGMRIVIRNRAKFTHVMYGRRPGGPKGLGSP
jgi:hypothetical protein